MKRLFLVATAAIFMVSCGGDEEIKLDDQNGFHQALSMGGEHGAAVREAESYDEFLKERENVEKYADAFKTQLGGECYLAYLKSVVSAIDGRVLTESDIDKDADIINIRTFYKTLGEQDDLDVSKGVAAMEQLGNEYGAKLKKAESKEAYLKVWDEIIAKEAELLKAGNKAEYNAFVECLFPYIGIEIY